MNEWTVYLVEEVEFVAARSVEEAVGCCLLKSENFQDGPPASAVPANADAGYFEDPYSGMEGAGPDRTMLEEAERRIAEGEALPFIVATSLDCI